jgi:hypothetical protein
MEPTDMSTANQRKWFDAIHGLESCSLCGRYGVQASHRNQGRGMGQKSADHLIAAICPQDHHEIDNGKNMTQAERRAAWNAAYVDTIDRLIRSGKLVLR